MIANTALQIYGTDEVIARPMRMKKKTPLSKIWFPENKDGERRPYFCSFFAAVATRPRAVPLRMFSGCIPGGHITL